MQKELPVIEIFGPVVQGEGPLIGTQTLFVRLGGCDYRCKWCDTLYAVLPASVRAEKELLTEERIIECLEALSTSTVWVTLSGGNPAIHNLTRLCVLLKERGYKIAVETQGSIDADWFVFVDSLVLSPKPPSSGMTTNFDMLDHILSSEYDRAVLKVVVFDENDYEYASTLFAKYLTVPAYLQTGTEMGVSVGEIRDSICDRTRWLVEKVCSDKRACMKRAKVLPQLHTLLYGQRRKV